MCIKLDGRWKRVDVKTVVIPQVNYALKPEEVEGDIVSHVQAGILKEERQDTIALFDTSYVISYSAFAAAKAMRDSGVMSMRLDYRTVAPQVTIYNASVDFANEH